MKTAVEQFFKDFYLYAEPYAYSIEEDKWVINEEDFNYLISKAKEMEKEQIIDGVIYGNTKPSMVSSKILGEQYYKETFKSE